MNLDGEFVRDINLPGWAEQSIWGYNALRECYWGALWRDEDRSDAPSIEFSVYHLIPTVALLTHLLAGELDLPEGQVFQAMTT